MNMQTYPLPYPQGEKMATFQGQCKHVASGRVDFVVT